jgi:hypothetical protein
MPFELLAPSTDSSFTSRTRLISTECFRLRNSQEKLHYNTPIATVP